MITSKEYAINSLEIAESNFLMALKGIKAVDITKQVHPEVNTIAWIVGHLVSHMDLYLSTFTGKRIFSKEQRNYFGYSSSKQTMKDGFPYSFVEIIEHYLKMSENFFKLLEELPEEKFNEIPKVEGFSETYFELLHRISLHYLGHTGQIVLIRRMIGMPIAEYWQNKDHGWSFVSGIKKDNREIRKEKWLSWWEENKKNFE